MPVLIPPPPALSGARLHRHCPIRWAIHALCRTRSVLQVPIALPTTGNETENETRADSAVLALDDADIVLQNWTLVATGRSQTLFPAGTANGQGGVYAITPTECSDALDYRPLAVPYAPLAPGNYSVCVRSGTTVSSVPRYIGYVEVVGPASYRTDPEVVAENASFRIRFDGAQLGPEDAWMPSPTLACNGTWQPVRSIANARGASAVEGEFSGLSSGVYSMCYRIRGTVVVLADTVIVEPTPDTPSQTTFGAAIGMAGKGWHGCAEGGGGGFDAGLGAGGDQQWGPAWAM